MQILTSGIVLSVVYSLMALSFVIIIRGTGVLNFALGAMLVLFPYIFFAFGGAHSGTAILALLGTCVVSAIISVSIYRILLMRLGSSQLWAAVISLFAVSDIIQAAAQLIWGSEAQFLQPIPFRVLVPLPGVTIVSFDLVIAIVGTIVIIGVFALTYGTRLGLQMRVTSEDRILAGYRGVSVERIAMISWAIGAVLAVMAGVALAMQTQLSPSLSNEFLTAFPAVLIGGFESLGGAVVGSIILAFLTVVVETYIGGVYSVAVGFGLLLLMILVRPYGLFGSRSEVRV